MTLEEQLIKHEGLKLKPYLDTRGKLTIGIGRNLDDKGITKDEALMLLRNDIIHATSALEEMIPNYSSLSLLRQRVLIDMCINLGVRGLKKFKKFLAAIKAGNFTVAADEMMKSKWADQVGKRATRLAWWMETNKELW